MLSSEEARQLGLPGGRSQWLDADINCFASCLSRCGKDFGFIAQQLQPPKTRAEVVVFYYDMWKTRRIPRAWQWYNSTKADVSPHLLSFAPVCLTNIEEGPLPDGSQYQISREAACSDPGWFPKQLFAI